MTFLVYKHISWNIYQTFSRSTEIKVKYFCDIMSVNIKTYAQKSCLNVKMRYRESLKIISLTFTSRLLLHCLTFCYEKDTVIYIRKNHIYCVNIWGTYIYILYYIMVKIPMIPNYTCINSCALAKATCCLTCSKSWSFWELVSLSPDEGKLKSLIFFGHKLFCSTDFLLMHVWHQ